MRIIFVQKFIPHYRLPFFLIVKAKLESCGIEFVLVHGEADPIEKSKIKTVSPAWAVQADNKILKIYGRYTYWQGVPKMVRKGDLVVVEHAAKLLDNYLLYAMARIRYIKLAYFGHGENFQKKHEFALARKAKEAMLRKVSMWFAYTEVSKTSLLRQGVKEQQITVVNNTLESTGQPSVDMTKAQNKFVYIGGLYDIKRIDVVIEAAFIAQKTISKNSDNFELHIVGDGPERSQAVEADQRFTWLTYHGSLFDETRAEILTSAASLLMPTAVGLVAIDSFQFGCPILTFESGEHGPEIAYLQDGKNALFTRGEISAKKYADCIIKFSQTPGLAQKLQKSCKQDAAKYTIEAMADKFVSGAKISLGAPEI